MSNQNNSPVVIEDESLDDVNGGILIGLLLPAVQKVQAPAPAPTSSMKSANNLRQIGLAAL